jgi:hypothetical protein
LIRERGNQVPKQLKLLGLNKGGSDSPFFRQKREEVCKGCVNYKGRLARKQLFTQRLIKLLKISSLPSYPRRKRKRNRDRWKENRQNEA